MSYREYPPSGPLLIGYDPEVELAADHLARLIEGVVENTITVSPGRKRAGGPAYDPRLGLKVLLYGYAVGLRSSRRLEQACRENLAFLYLSRGQAPSYRTLCTMRTECREELDLIWLGLHAVAQDAGIRRVGKLVIDSTKLRADVGTESVVREKEYDAVLKELEAILKEAEEADLQEEQGQARETTALGGTVDGEQMRDILRRVRHHQAEKRRKEAAASAVPDAAVPDAAVPDAAVPDAAVPDAAVPDAAVPDAVVPDAAVPDAVVPDATITSRPPLGPRMKGPLKQGIAALEKAKVMKLKQVSLTDPDARMMGEGCSKGIKECHSFEIVTDSGLLLVAQRSPEPTDYRRLAPLVKQALHLQSQGFDNKKQPIEVTADSGYYSGGGVAQLLEQGYDVCVPSNWTAADLRRGLEVGSTKQQNSSPIPMEYEVENDQYRCPAGKLLKFRRAQEQAGQMVRAYRAQEDCTGCSLASQCLRKKGSRHRTLKISEHEAILDAHLARFKDPEHQNRYHGRAPAVETPFAVIRHVMGISRWSVRGANRVGTEARLIGASYQVRKLQKAKAKNKPPQIKIRKPSKPTKSHHEETLPLQLHQA